MINPRLEYMRAYRAKRRNEPEWKEGNNRRSRESRKRQLANNPELFKQQKRDSQLKWWYGINQEDYNLMFTNQNGKCTICGISDMKLHIDHDHTTGKVRALLCVLCNTALGKFKENKDILMKAIDYLERYK